MSVTFKSPASYKGSPLSEKPSNQPQPQLHQEFMRAIEQRQFFPTTTTTCQYHHMEDLQPMNSQFLNKLMMELTDKQLLLIDVRSFDCYSQGRLKTSIHISIPSILLKRPSYTLEKVCSSIQSSESKERLLNNWHNAQYILFYDQSSYKPADSSNNTTAILLGSKLRNIGYQGHLNYLEGGFDAFYKEYPEQCDMTKKTKENNKPLQLPLPTSIPVLSDHNPFFSNIRQNLELAHGPLKERFPIRLPFGLNYEQGVIKIQPHSPPYPTCHPRYGLAGTFLDKDENLILPFWLNQVLDSNNGPTKLAQLYETLERTEQNRLSTIMRYHASTNKNQVFPFSITSSMEKGALNRYDNIWPYEYSRVKLEKETDQYINANYLQFSNIKKNITVSPMKKSENQVVLEDKGLLSEASVRTMNKQTQDLVSTRPYICTQGPLPNTVADFWKMIWDEHAPVIVMLTQEFELNKVKCHRYWPSVAQDYGSVHVKCLSEVTHPVTNGSPKRRQDDEEVIIVRQFQLTKDKEERIVTHLQYPSWTDFGVPDLPIGLLQLVHEADAAYQPTGPMVVHCSAGCGRSGTFCVIDTMIQRLWHERDVYTSMNEDKLFETISRFREQRMSIVQTHRQFVFCYEVIVWWLLGYGYLPVSSSPVEQII